MTIRAPKYPGGHDDREIDGQEALEPAFLTIVDDLENTGCAAEEAAEAVLQASFSMDDDSLLAERLRSLAAWAVHAGWYDAEARSAIRQLATHRAISFKVPEDAEQRVSALLKTLH
ncbi:hypothetical protein [Oricola sp.]|uniref:hypothetical protein n=1 Tax=Oricola sp. TaxID=1979950 RepID=UPI003BAB1F42